MSEDNRTYLAAVIRTLNKISVSGEENLDMMLGCIRTLRKMLEGVDNDG